MTYGQMFVIGPFNFTVIRVLIAIGVIRLILRGERISGGMIALDWSIVLWSIWSIMSCFLQEDASLTFRLGWVYNVNGVYFILRTFCQDNESIEQLFRMTAIILIPLSITMLLERLDGYNIFHFFGGVPKYSMFRDGSFRAQGPFTHSIMAGTVGAVCFPLVASLWNKTKFLSVIGCFSCFAMVFACGSAGPKVGIIACIFAMLLFNIRDHVKILRWIAVFAYIGLDIVMKVPAYYLMARLPGSGGGYHRALLIENALANLDEWWLAGTDYTRHWMPTGVTWNPNHADITNHYIKLGVMGGLPLMLLFIATIYIAFKYVGFIIKNNPEQSNNHLFFFWAIGSSLFAHAAIMISVSYFDQSFVFLYATLAVIGSIRSQGALERPGSRAS
jgi:hypothetical protein